MQFEIWSKRDEFKREISIKIITKFNEIKENKLERNHDLGIKKEGIKIKKKHKHRKFGQNG